ncbi:MAG: cyclase family protein [Pseudomonadales bacterium]|nr:cyclase family protein [Pseudomonadales bacterium]
MSLLGLLCAPMLRAANVTRAEDRTLWTLYQQSLQSARYIDLTHAFAPGQPRGVGFAELKVSAARADVSLPGLITKGAPFTYQQHGVGITAYEFPTDQVGTQLDPPAHWNAYGATISDLPPTFAIRPLVVINIAPQVAADPGYQASVADVRKWERQHGRIPAGSVVMFRSDWSKKWTDSARFVARPFPGVSLVVLKFLHLERQILMHGHEPLDTDSTPDFAGESWLLRHNFAQAEGVMNLDLVPEAGALILIGFAKPEGGTGGFARYIAVAPASWPHGLTIAEAPGAPLPTRSMPLARGADGVLRPAINPATNNKPQSQQEPPK